MQDSNARPPGMATVAVAFSGGRDSLALLHATVRAAKDCGAQVVALHVHHGLMAEADAWAQSAIRLCGRWQRAGWPLRLRWHRLDSAPARGDSIEAWARRERYAALAQLAREEGATLLLLAQHRRDQAETVLLQALRGAGPRGLAAMPRVVDRHGLCWARPWLDQPREAIEAYVRRHRLKPIDDPSNLDPRFARSRLRLQVWPALCAAFEDADITLTQVARRAQEADAALAELAAIDLAASATANGLQRPRWLLLSAARRANALRAWLAALTAQTTHEGRGAPEALVQRLLTEWPERANGRWPAGAGRELVSYRGVLRLAVELQPAGQAQRVDLSQAGRVSLPAWAGEYRVEPVDQGGVPPCALREAELRPRSGGEQFQRAPNTPPRSLKKQYQLAGVAADLRQGPLVWADGQLVYVPGLGIDARVVAPAGTPQLRLQWLPNQRAPRAG
ncbi:tRNA lysidine(34) synthetase TilS [Aquabacterium sp.]|uniref:tRNA lysidine(34) synthetase TilS n=1 Tax=Aquabacterium sp. TaxID=1872578 RepID=UPI002BD22E9F|nr:tRNA lysidine(34) synthetase TilS [Aquabacterium sp.]HSW04548.1 tRNA lysidine(34) synthetase TilS [Aquabacterium sp.]